MKLAKLIAYYARREYSHPADGASMVARSMGGEFISHKHIPEEFQDSHYGGMSMPDDSLLLLGNELKCIGKIKEPPYYEDLEPRLPRTDARLPAR